MIEILKKKTWNLLKNKKVSLAMIYDTAGNILWSKGRKIFGRTVADGGGFSKTYIRQAFEKGDIFQTEGAFLTSEPKNLTDSIMALHIKSLIITRINGSCFLYIDSGCKERFSATDCEVFRVIGEMLGDYVSQIKRKEADVGGITGSSTAIQKIRERVLSYSLSTEPVLLTGETGTGKSHIARLIHDYSGRTGKFKVVHTPGIPENLFESELFGYKKGAFTDARTDKKGLVEEADGGTLFIDEITETSTSLQAKLLRFIETGKYTPLGDSEEKIVDVRIVAASNKDLYRAMAEKEFREDLYYRLNVLEIQLPPLRERKEDLEPLVMEKEKFLRGKKIGSGFWDAIRHHHWPGNVRELNSILKRAGTMEKNQITGSDIHDFIDTNYGGSSFKPGSDEIESIWASIKKGKNFWDAVKVPFLDRDLKRSEVRAIVARGLAEANGRYKKLVKLVNLEQTDYHRFMRFLHEQDLQPSN